MNNSYFTKLGSGIHSQTSINANVNEKKIVEFVLINLKKISSLNLADNPQKELINFIEKNRSFPFEITKHIDFSHLFLKEFTQSENYYLPCPLIYKHGR